MDIPVIDWVAELLGTERGHMVRKVLQLAVLLLLGWAGTGLVRLIARRIELAADDGDATVLSAGEKRGQTIAQLVRSVGRAVVLVAVLLSSLNLFIDIRPLLAGVGILSLAVSFGAQSLVKDLISGFFILLENQFVVGDGVRIGEHSGTVEQVSLRAVRLRDLHGALHIIPNGSIPWVINTSRGWSRAVVDIPVSYGTDVDHALAVVRDELTKFRADSAWKARFDGGSEVVGIDRFGDNGIVIRTLIRTVPGSEGPAFREFSRRLKYRLDAEGIQIPAAQRTILMQPPHTARPESADPLNDGDPLDES